MACAISREVRDGQVNVVGTLSPIPASGVLLARATHAPRSTVIVIGSERWWPFTGGSKEFYDFAQKGRFDLFFLSGGQIDEQANLNLTTIGDHDHPLVRLPGGAGSSMLYFLAKRIVLFKTDHTRRGFVRRVDFLTAPGASSPKIFRPGGPSKTITPLATLAYGRAANRLEVESLHPGVTLEEVQANTGFTLAASDPISVTPPPTPGELEILRRVVMPDVAQVYPIFARHAFRAA